MTLRPEELLDQSEQKELEQELSVVKGKKSNARQRKKVNEFDYSTDFSHIHYHMFLPKPRLMWLALPDEVKEAIKKAGKTAFRDILLLLERHKDSFHFNPVVSAYIYSVLLGRLKSIEKELKGFASSMYASPPMRIHSLGFWLDELNCPEEAVWLSMTVPRRIWYQLATNPIKRHKFLEFIRTNFSDETPVDRKLDSKS